MTNRTKEPIEIVWTLNPSQYFDLIVSDADGKRIETRPYWSRFSPYAHEQYYTLRPNEPYRQPVYLWTVFPDGKLPPGTYRVRAVFKYWLLRCHSGEVMVVVK